MVLLNTETGLFEEFIGRHIPEYAILSHTWEDEEVSFQDMSDPASRSKKGFAKIDMTCRQAAGAGILYAWVDTCCIDKSSSAELTEAINSMYVWYGRAKICYVYLSDLAASASLDEELPKCRWFTRGWTLQELRAPEHIDFFDRFWQFRGTKRDLLEPLSKITGIRSRVLAHEEALSSVCVAQKMSWAANRETTRIEDTAYCLFGIFDINMPLLYGEEHKAFRRLQEEIIRSSHDLSIYAWKIQPDTPAFGELMGVEGRRYSGVLAFSPDEFAGCRSYWAPDYGGDSSDSQLSNRGIKMRAMKYRELVHPPLRERLARRSLNSSSEVRISSFSSSTPR
ncbi:heterokaryon incompatibility protein-domain-containing protein [Echria macrotheca]|uniref:Heterokaryon incompatibility protein-domain-containing protein n=1 Tax=Echria macrotheca TaxID=438768 RepID=A0AAJ0BGJ4_9PEZI|nr:heterokaryon incompatibility protein-domain-containing protein [Echria macrotheca]